MPDGKVQWFDAKTGEARIVRGNRAYPAAAADVEPAARHPGARVHFDIDRRGGADHAVRVRMRAGTRTSHLQRRFGDLSGAYRADSKGTAPFTRPHPDLGLRPHQQPARVAERWAALIASGDLEEAVLLYAPHAVLRTDGDVFVGPARVRGFLETSPLLGSGSVPDVRGEDGTVILRWGRPGREPVAESHVWIAHGEIREQWIGSYWVARAEPEEEAAVPPVHVLIGDGVGAADRDYAAEKVTKILGFADQPVLFALARLYKAADPARPRPAIAEATIDLDGQPLRAHVAAHTVREAVDLLEQRLRDKLDHLAEHRRSLRRRPATSGEGEWRHGDLPAHRPPFFDRPAEARELVRHKTFAVDELTPDEAVFDLDVLDYDFHLFRDLTSDDDAVVYRDADGLLRLARLHGARADVPRPSAPIDCDEQAAPVLSVAEAIERLDTSNERFLFFADDRPGRGRVLYRRYDGHYGLIVPANEPHTAPIPS